MPDLYHKHMTQRVYSDPNWRVNCTAYCAAMLITDATLGGADVTGRIVRAWSSEPNPSPGSPGLNITQIIDVAWQFRVKITDHQKQPWSEAMRLLDDGRRVLMQLDYKELGKYRCQATGDFAHAVVLVRPAEADGFIRVSDPLCSEGKRIPEAVVKEAARVFARRTGVDVGLRWCATRVVPETVKSID
jgi:hypothetical protein